MRRLLILSAVMAAIASTALAAERFHVGVTNRAFLAGNTSYDWRGAKTHALLTTIWYPADSAAEEKPQWVGDPAHPFASAGRAATDGRLAASPAKFPLVLLSHGTGGSALMMAWLGTELAAHGYIAAAVNHPGNNALEPYTVEGFTLGWERALDLSKVLDAMLADPEFGNRIDAASVGAAGFSFGGYTVLEIAGGIGTVDAETIQKRCGSPDSTDSLCASLPEFPSLVKKAIQLLHDDPRYAATLDKSAKSHQDPRIKAVFAIAPALGETFSPETLAGISIPVEMVAGASDPIAPPAANAHYFAAHIPHANLTIYPGGVAHYTFLGTCTAAGAQAVPQFCRDNPGVNRDAIHGETALKAVTFFDRHLSH